MTIGVFQLFFWLNKTENSAWNLMFGFLQVKSERRKTRRKLNVLIIHGVYFIPVNLFTVTRWIRLISTLLFFKVSPMIWVPNQLVGAPAGTDVTIDCHTEAYPRAISYWVFNSVMLLPTKKYVTDISENSYRAHMRLTVRSLQAQDFGNYRCISKNSLGETEGSIRLYGKFCGFYLEKRVIHHLPGKWIENSEPSGVAGKIGGRTQFLSETKRLKRFIFRKTGAR